MWWRPPAARSLSVSLSADRTVLFTADIYTQAIAAVPKTMVFWDSYMLTAVAPTKRAIML